MPGLRTWKKSRVSAKTTVGAYLVALAVAIALPMLAFIAIILWHLQTNEDIALLQRTEREAESVARAAGNQLRDMTVTLRLLTSAPELEEEDLKDFHLRTQSALRQNNWFLIVVDKTGHQLHQYPRPVRHPARTDVEHGLAQRGADQQADSRLRRILRQDQRALGLQHHPPAAAEHALARGRRHPDAECRRISPDVRRRPSAAWLARRFA